MRYLSNARAGVTSLVFLALAGCGVADLSTGSTGEGEAFISVSRGALTGTSDASTDFAGNADHFYIAISKAELGKKWFMSGYLTQWHPAENTPMRSLGTRVVTFAVQNGKLYVFDATDGKAWSDVLDPSVVIEAYPLVTDFAPFNALPNAGSYVLFDPSAGLNRFGVVSDDFAAGYWARFQIDLTYLKGFKTLGDGASWEQVFTGYTELAGPGINAYEQPFRGSGTLAVSLRRYSESAGFTSTPMSSTTRNFFPSSNWQYVKNEAALKQYAVKWNIKPGMTPIPWRISAELAALQNDPRYQGVDLAGAIERGIEGWNDAFGFPVFTVVPAAPGESPGDDDKNFVVVDRNPGAGLAFANWRENPNTGEIRGASVYFSAAFVAGAVEESADAGELMPLPVVDAGSMPPPAVCAPGVVLSQVFGGNSATGVLNQDFIELHNRTSAAVSLGGWSVQYASANGTSWQVLPLSGTIPPNGFFLLGLAASAGGTALVAADQTLGVNLSASAGKVALVASTVALSGACPAAGAALDFVGYGAASCSEAAPVTGASSALGVVRRDATACADTDSNASDFVAAAPAARNTSAAASACTCAAATMAMPSLPFPFSLGSPTAKSAGHMLSWDAMPAGTVCTLHGAAKAQIPAGMTRREYVERVIEHTISHEVGHTLGLRHNFKGSLTGTSVMDYLRDDVAAANPKPGAYDVAAVRYLYGLDAATPSQPFCTDEDRMSSAECDVWDNTATPLTSDLQPRYQAKIRGLMTGANQLQFADLHRVTRYVRGPASEAQRLEAFNVMMADAAPPLSAEVVALSANAAAYADLVAMVVLANLYLDPVEYRDEVQVNPAIADAAFRTRVIAVAKDILIDSDKHRSFEARRVAIDTLKALQHYEAYQALVEARVPLAAERATYTPVGQSLIDDLTRRIDVQTSPYFRQ